MFSITEKSALSVTEAHCYLGIARAQLYRLMGSGELPSLHIGRRRLVLREDLDAFLRARRAEGQGA